MKVILCPHCGAVKDYRLVETTKRGIRFDAEGNEIGKSINIKTSRTARKLCACGRVVRVIDIDMEKVKASEDTGD
jgi:hypothetical protein